jgi:MFS family permease
VNDATPRTAPGGAAKGALSELVRDGRAAYTIIVVAGAGVHALQILVIAIIMPTIVADIGGAAYYAWPSMLYTVGSIIGASSIGPVWAALGPRRGYALSGLVFVIGTAVCAVAPDMAVLNAARGVQGYAGGLVSGGGMALISGLFEARLRTRVLSLTQGTFTACHLLGPVAGGIFAAVGWWRGSFWVMVPILAGFALLTWFKVPANIAGEAEHVRGAGFAFGRLTTLTAGVFCVAATGPIDRPELRVALLALAVVLVWVAFRLDRGAVNRLFPSRALSFSSPVGLALWILLLAGLAQTAITLFLPLLLQVVHGVTPVIINFVTMTISGGWTVGTFLVAGWSGARERVALATGPVLCLAGLAGIAAAASTVGALGLVLLTLAAFVMGVGIGLYNVHLVARTMESAAKGESRTTAASMSMIRSLGTAFGAAIAGVIVIEAGLGTATEPAAVERAVSTLYFASLVPLALAALCMARFLRLGRARAAPGQAEG